MYLEFLPPIFLELQSQFPGLATSFIAASGKKLNEYLISGQADIALAFDPVLDPDIEQIASIKLPIGAVISPSHPLSNKETVTLEDCIDYPLILPDESWPLHDILNRELASLSPTHNVVATTSNSMEFLRSMLGKESRIGFQTIIGLEEPIRSGDLFHIPLINHNHSFTQQFVICINRNQETSAISESILHLLSQRLDRYNSL